MFGARGAKERKKQTEEEGKGAEENTTKTTKTTEIGWEESNGKRLIMKTIMIYLFKIDILGQIGDKAPPPFLLINRPKNSDTSRKNGTLNLMEKTKFIQFYNNFTKNYYLLYKNLKKVFSKLKFLEIFSSNFFLIAFK